MGLIPTTARLLSLDRLIPTNFDLVDAYLRHGYNRKVHRITKRQLNRGANAVADLLSAIARSR